MLVRAGTDDNRNKFSSRLSLTQPDRSSLKTIGSSHEVPEL
jgi:hypothetical protein